METILIFAAGDGLRLELAQDLPLADLVVAADSGYEVAVALGFRVDVVVGDFDSISTTPLPDHVIVEKHEADKDQTDLDLALELAIREDPARVVVVGGAGGRQDHELAAFQLICSPRWRTVDELDWLSNRSRCHVVRRHRVVHGDIGATVTLLAVGGPVHGLSTRGLAWELHDATLEPGSTWGVSNLMKAPVADIRIDSGCLLVVYPEE